MSAPSLNTYLAELLADQQTLQTPVTRAAVAHDLQPSAWRADRFREIIPLTAPGPGERYAFEVDLDSCSGCKACVSGCHSLNGLDPEETWRDVGIVHAAIASSCSAPIAQTVTTACHHCEDPACLNGCPVLAYEQDPLTGIVRHLDDQCIGCSYCVLKCPYDVPKYNERLGIVRKCDLCHGRLAAGEAPACAQACPTQAIKVVLVPVSAHANAEPARATLASLSGTDSAYTRPTTRYVSKKTLPSELRAADADTLRPQPAHAPLVALLVLTQLSLGLLISAQIIDHKSLIINSAAAALFAAGLSASVFHLGQPLRAWRVFLNLRRSWLSREAVILGLAFPLVVATAALPHVPALFALSPLPLSPTVTDLVAHWSVVIGRSALLPWAALALTAAGVACSAMLYIDTRRRFWRPAYTVGRMGGTVFVAALAFAAPPAAAVALVAKLALELVSAAGSSASARLQRGPLLAPLFGRLFLGALAALLFALREPALGFVCFALGELVERALYFRAVDTPKMPGLPASGK